ncbi:MAG TPA: sugar phosphate nucleotidyltransferase [Actinomycetota bacterium]|nr:sugar phosphate nucleotidyltransferase [Actinomycetota bacterium]
MELPRDPAPESSGGFASVLFAAGRGARLRPLSDVVPKPALPLGGAPLGARALAVLVRECPPVLVNLAHMHARVRRALAPYAPPGAVAFAVESPEPYGTGGTLAAARERLAAPVVTWNADVVTDLRPADLLGAHAAGGAPATVAVRTVDRGADLLVRDRRAIGFVDRRTSPGAAGAAFLGIAVFEPEALALLPDRRPLGLAEGLLRPLAARGRLGVHVHEGYWIDVGTPGRYARAWRDELLGRAPALPSATAANDRRGS